MSAVHRFPYLGRMIVSYQDYQFYKIIRRVRKLDHLLPYITLPTV